MALSLNDIKGARLRRDTSKDAPPKKKPPVMPWQDMGEQPVETIELAPSSVEPVSSQAQNEISDNSEPDRSQIEANSEPKRSQIRAKTEPKRSRIEANSEPERSRRKGAVSEIGATHGAESKPDRSQNGARSEPHSEPKSTALPDIGDLSRLQVRCLQFVFESCRFAGSRTSERLFSGDLAEKVKSTPAAVKKAMQRLGEGGVIERDVFKKGPGGWTRYRIPEAVYKELSIREIRAGSEPERSQFGARSEPQSEPRTEPSPPSSSSLNKTLSKTTTSGSQPWDIGDVDYSMLTDIGFGRSQIAQLRNIGLDRDVVQKSLLYFDFELRHTDAGRGIREPLNLLMKHMRHQGCWIAPEGYEERMALALADFQSRSKHIDAISAAREGGE